MESNELVKYRRSGFDNKLYLSLQKRAIEKRLDKFSNGKLYLEIGGKLLFDTHAQRVLPGFDPENKLNILKSLQKDIGVIFCINAQDIENNRKLDSTGLGYIKSTINLIQRTKQLLKCELQIAINLVDQENIKYALEYKSFMKSLGFDSFFRYRIKGYPKSDDVLSENGYGRDEYIPIDKKLIIITGAGSNSGKLSTCLGQIYLENLKGVQSGYAKYETFPIWNLDLHHPINLAYEAATADIGDFNIYDTLNEVEHNTRAVNYNRDVKSFTILKDFAEKLENNSNYISRYKSPTDMGINMAGFCITDDEIVSIASTLEIMRRINWYKKLNDYDAMKRCINIYNKAVKYLSDNDYNVDVEF